MSNARNLSKGLIEGRFEVNHSENSNSAFPSGNWAAKVYNQFDAPNEGGLVVANRWEASASSAFLVGGLHDGGDGFNEYLKVDGIGHVTMTKQPAFYVKDLTYTVGGDSLGTGGVVQTNRGGCYNTSNGRFTAPVSGMYYFWGTQQHFGSGSTTYVGLIFNKNGVQDTIEYVSGVGGSYNNHQTQEGAYVTYLNVNDYVNIRSNRGARNGIQNVFLGYLLG